MDDSKTNKRLRSFRSYTYYQYLSFRKKKGEKDRLRWQSVLWKNRNMKEKIRNITANHFNTIDLEAKRDLNMRHR